MSSVENIVIDIQGGKNAKNELYTAIYKLLYRICAKYLRFATSLGWESDDLLSVAWLGVEGAIKDFNPTKGYKFATYLNYHISNHFREFLGLNNSKIYRVCSMDDQINDTDGLTYGDTIEDENATKEFEQVEKSDYYNCLYEALKKLPQAEEAVLKGYFWNNETLQQLAKRLNKGRGAIERHKNIGLRKLRKNTKIKACYYENFAYRHISRATFNTTWTSSTEWAAMEIMERTAE